MLSGIPKLFRMLGWNGTSWRPVAIDQATRATTTITYGHHEIHGASRFYHLYSVPSLGAMTTPDDMITLTWTTPDTTKWEHFSFWAAGTGGWRLRLIEAPTGGAASATGDLPMLNHQRNSLVAATCISLAAAAGSVSYDATLATGGVTLWDEYIPGGAKASGNALSATRDEIVLKQNTKYQLSLYGTDADPGTMLLDWYEHTDKAA